MNKLIPSDLTLIEMMTRFATESAAREYLESLRWPQGPECPHCGIVNEAARLEGKSCRAGLYKCRVCEKQFTVTVNTVMEDSHIPLNKWLLAFYLMCSAKKGVSALQLQRQLAIGSYRTAWFLCHRVRYALEAGGVFEKLDGTIEADECYVGGKVKGKGRGYRKNKTAVVALIQRDGSARSFAMPVENVTGENLKRVLEENVSFTAVLNTDESPLYTKNGKAFAGHDTVNHRSEEYVRHDKATGRVATTNAAEGYFANLRRQIDGTHHQVGRKHLQKYLTEYNFKYNNRTSSDGTITIKALGMIAGKRLMLRAPKGAVGANR